MVDPAPTATPKTKPTKPPKPATGVGTPVKLGRKVAGGSLTGNLRAPR